MRNLLTQFKIALIAFFAVLFFVTVHGAQAATLYWYSTGDTSWTSTANWYTDADHTSQAGAIPTTGDSVMLLGAVAPVIDLDNDSIYYLHQPSSMDSAGLTGASYISGVIFTSVVGHNWNGNLEGNATFNGYSFNTGNIYGNAIFNNFSHNLSNVAGDATFNNFAYNASSVGGFATFNNNSYNYSYNIGNGAVFNDNSYNYNGSIYGAPATFNNNSHNIQGYVDVAATFNDNSYDYYGSYTNSPTFNNTNQQFVFNAAQDNDWSNPNNWVGGIVPGPNDDVYIINQVASNGAGSDVVARSATFYGYDALWATGGTLTVTNGVTFSNSARNASGTVVGTTTFDFNAFNQGTVTGPTTFNNYSYNEGNINGDVVFSYNSFNNSGYINASSVVFVNNSYNGYNPITSPTVASFLESYTYGDTYEAHFYRFSNNYGTVSSTTDFYSSSVNQGSINSDAYFYDSASNAGFVDGNGYFVGENSENNGTVTGSLVRKYVLNIGISRDFTSGGYWTIMADGAIVDVTSAIFNIHNTFTEVNGGSFIGAGGFPGVTINSPAEGSTITSWSPSVAWHATFNDYVTCQYSYDTNVWFGASCAGSGSDIVATTTYGSQTLTIRATDSLAQATTSSVTYNYTPSRLVYFYSNGSDPSWTTVGNWYTNAGHTIPAGSVPASIDNVTVVGSTAPQVNLDAWVQPTNIYTPTGIVFTSSSSASTSATITGPATFNNSAKNNGRITGNAIFNNTSSNASSGRVVGNATFSASSTNAGTVVLNATFYADDSANTGTVSGVKTRYYTATTTTTRNFTGGWTVVADGVTVTVTNSTYDGTTKFKTLNGGYFLGGPSVVYWSSNIPNGLWTDTTNWYSDSNATVHINRVASSTETVVVVGNTSPQVDLDNVNWVAPAGIDASLTGITFTSAANAVLDTSVTGTTTFAGNVRNTSTILGTAIFASSTRNNAGGVVSGGATFLESSINNGGVITGDVDFNGSSYNTNGSVIYGDTYFFDSSYNATTSGDVYGTTYFYGTSHNSGTLSNDATFYAEATENFGTVSGIKTRYYLGDATTTRDFVTTGPWTLVADGATVHLDDTAVFASTTVFTEINGGNFTGNSVPGSYTDCAKPLIIPGTYTFEGNVTNVCNIQSEGVSINGAGHSIGRIGIGFPDNSSSSGWLDMSDNIFTYHMNDTGPVVTNAVTSQSSNVNGAVTSQAGKLGNSMYFPGSGSYINTGVNFTGIRSISLWFNDDGNDGVNNWEGVLGTSDDVNNSGPGFELARIVFGGSPAQYFWFAFEGGTRTDTQLNIPPGNNTWRHLVITRDNTNTYVYLNGTLINTISGHVWDDAAAIQIGRALQGGSKYYKGKLDEVTFWSNTLSVGNVASLYNSGTGLAVNGNESGLVAAYHLDEPLLSVVDSSGNSYQNSSYGSPTYGVSGVIDNAITFSGAVIIGSPITMPSENITASFWLNFSDTTTSGIIMAKGYGSGDNAEFEIGYKTWGSYGLDGISSNSDGTYVTFTESSGGPITTGVWYHYAVTYDGTYYRIYRNGVQTGISDANTGKTRLLMNDTGFLLGARYDYPDTLGGTVFNGKMDEVAVWSRTLSASDIQSIYENQVRNETFFNTNNHSLSLANANISGALNSAGATIHLTDITIGDVDVSGANAPGNAQDGGTIVLVNSHAGALTANGGNSTDYGYGGLAGSISIDGDSTAGTQTANPGDDGPNLGAGQQSGGNSGGNSSVRGCTDPSATNYSASATVYDGSCRYAQVTVRGCTNPSATNYNANATVNDGSCTYPSYNTVNPHPSSSGGGNSNSQNNNASSGASGSTISGVNLELKKLRQLLLNTITGVTPVITNSTGVTNFGNVLAGFNPIGQLNLTPLNFEFAPTVSAFLFAPLPEPIASAVKNFPKLSSLLASVGVSREQDLVTLMNNPVLLPEFTESDMAPGIFLVVGSSSKPLKAYLASDPKHRIVESVNASPGETLTVSLIPLSKGKVQAVFGDEIVDFFASKQKAVYAVITVPKTPGRYFLITKSAPFPLAINIVAPPEPPKPQKLTFIQRVIGWFGKLLR